MKNTTYDQKDSAHPLLYKGCALAMAMSTAFTPTVSSAAGLFPGLIGRTVLPRAIDVNQLPAGFALKSGLATFSTIDGTMTITQSSDKAIIDWSSFDIGKNAAVNFKQGSSSSAVLNRIYDQNPSIINGSLTANGKVYLINRNGVFFGPSGSVQVQSLVASAFNISDTNFNNGRLIFESAPYDSNQTSPVSDDTVIQNEGKIITNSGGTVFFVGPQVKNLGTISAPTGKIDLVGLKANGQVEIREITQDRDSGDIVYTDTSLAGDVYNMAGGSLYGADGGMIGLHGNTVYNGGLIRAITTRSQNGVIYLRAKDLVATGEGSATEVEVSDSSVAMSRYSQGFNTGSVAIGGLSGTGVNALARVDHEGRITARSGTVGMEASERVFFGEKSSIDVSGLTIESPMTEQFIEAQLNSLYLRDDYGQKSGTLLGDTVTIDVLKGSSIGNLSGYYLGMTKTAQELSTAGGTISIGAPSGTVPGSTSKYTLGDIIISKGAAFDISGGSVTYSGSATSSSKLIASNGSVYDISTAPQWLTYTGVLGSTTKSYGKFGSETLKGISFGGHLMKLQSTGAPRVVGGSAGSLTLQSRVIEGLHDDFKLKATVTTGQFQTVTTPYLDSDKSAATTSAEYQRYLAYLISQNRGLEAPKGGKLVIGNKMSNTISAQTYFEDAGVGSIVVKKSSHSTLSTGWNGSLSSIDTPTVISADMITRAGLSSLELNANTSITTEKDAAIVLRPGGSSWISTTDKDGNVILRTFGSYSATARRIEFLGSITAAGGAVDMLIRPNISSDVTSRDAQRDSSLYQQVAETIYLGSDSRISTAGERIDNSALGLSPLDMRKGGITSGGSISLIQDSPSGVTGYALTNTNENSIVVSQGALLDVSGGYLINEKGAISGGNAGTLTLKAPTISLGGDSVRGFALPGKDGGELVLHAQEVRVVNGKGSRFDSGFGMNDTIPADLLGKLVLGADSIQSSGFSRISLTATDNLTIDAGAQLTPSLRKIDMRNTTATTTATCAAGECVFTSYPTFLDQIGKTSISLNAGKKIYDSATDLSGTAILNNQKASLTIVEGAGAIVAPGGAISLSAPNVVDIGGTVKALGGSISVAAATITLESSGQISAAGYNKQGIATKVDQLAPLPVAKAGGTVSLAASSLDLKEGSLVDVSGSKLEQGYVRDAHGLPTSVAVAGDAGSLTLVYGTKMLLNGTIDGGVKMAGAQGGSLTVKNSSNDLMINDTDLNRYQKAGFDALTFGSLTGIIIPAKLNLSVGRSLTLDSPLIKGTGSVGDIATINAPWIKLVNTGSIYTASSPETVAEAVSGAVSFHGGYLDVQGSTLLRGFSQVALHADHDLTLADRTYTDLAGTKTFWSGSLGTSAANLTLQANRIYPTTASNFTVTTPGRVTILPGTVDSTPIYSAGGSLTITANGGIDHRGYLAAPMGSITLDSGDGRVDLSSSSVITTAASAPVAYGTYDSSTWWSKYVDSSTTGTEVTSAPAKSITLKGNEVVVRDGATQDLSGGGSVYASYWQSGIPGTYNPLTVLGRYVVLPNGSGPHTGTSVYLEACPALGLKAGFYSILPSSFAFVPGALVIQATGTQLLPGQTILSKEHYHVVGGYKTQNAVATNRQVLTAFSVRLASDVLKEGDFTVKTFVAGDGGTFTLSATNGAYFGGTLGMNPLTGYQGGVASFAAKNVAVLNTVTKPDFSQSLSDTLQLAGDKLSSLPIRELRLGEKDATSSVTVQDNVKVQAASVVLSAADKVIMKDGAQVEATGTASGDYVKVVTPGVFSMGKKAGFTSKKGIVLEVNSYALDDSATLNSGASGYFSLSADRITFDDASKTFWKNTFANNGTLEITGRSGMYLAFQEEDVNLKNSGTLTLDAPVYSSTAGSKNVNFESGNITLRNSATSASSTTTSATSGELTFKADSITVTPRLDGTKGNIVFDGIKTVNMDSKNDLVFKGEGTVSTQGGLNLYAARITTDADNYKSDSDYTVANITLDGRSGAVTLNGSTRNGTAGTTSTPGGSLTILGDGITQTGGVLDTAAGQINLTAVNDISVSGAILAKGMGVATAKPNETAYYSGGKITLQSDKGRVDLKSGSTLDVSAAAQGDAGSIVLSATSTGKGVSINKDVTDANGVVTKGARLAGAAGSGGKGGSFSIDSASLDGVGGLDGLSSTLATRTLLDKSLTGGFNNQISIRSRSGDLVLSSDSTTLTGREVVIAADNGAITISGKTVLDKDGNQVVTGGINADTSDGSGRIELYAGKKLNLESGATLTARGKDAGAHGGTVLLSSQDGSGNTKTFGSDYALNVKDGSTIDVSGNGGAGGTVAFRAYKNASNTDVNMAAVGGDTIKGASSVSVEAVQEYTANAGTTPISGVTYDTVGELGSYTKYLTDAGTTKDRLFKAITDTSAYHLKEGIEISSSGNLLVDKELDLKSVNPGGEAVVLTLKSGKDLLVNEKISDARTSIDTLHSSAMQDSAAINLVAGSDGGANYMGVAKGNALNSWAGTGDLTIASGVWVYTENAPIRFAAGNDVFLKGTSTGPGTMINTDMKYNLGSYGGSVRGDMGRDLNLVNTGSAIQTALGNIDIRTGRNLNLGSLANTGAIRTTGEFDNSALTAKMPGMTLDRVANRTSYWTYHNGGSIGLDVGNSVNGNLDAANGWDGAYVDSSATAAQKARNSWYLTAGFGGSKETSQISNIPVTVGIGTMGGGDIIVKTGCSLMAQVGAFGKGNVAVSTGGDMNGRFRVMGGMASLSSRGTFGTVAKPVVFELANAQVNVASMGDVRLGSVQNPDNTRDRIFFGSQAWNMTYTPDTSFSASSLAGDTTLYGSNQYNAYSMTNGAIYDRRFILPASFALSAAGDISVLKRFFLAPSAKGNLGLFAGGNISGVYDTGLLTGFRMQDVDIASMYNRQVDQGGYVHLELLRGVIHTGLNHKDDTVPVSIVAGNDISDLDLYLNKPAEVMAKGNITGFNFSGQNINQESLSSIEAGVNIDQGITVGANSKPTIEIGGPGTLLVQAGGNILLGNSLGINSVGNNNNTYFSASGPGTDSDLIISAGANSGASLKKTDVQAFFDKIRVASDEISRLKADGKTDEAATLLASTELAVRKYFYTYDETKSGTGNIDMVDSAISSRSGSIYAMAGSAMNVGKTALSSAPLTTSGITTLYGGDLMVYAGGDINVNESRIMTYLGSDITIWSDQGNINAGRGSKTTVSAPTPMYTFNKVTNLLESITYTAPSAGSGIGGMTFDPDGSGPLAAPEAGDIHIYAKGTLDAGEAGIQGGKMMIAASTVLNSQNIAAGIGSVGVPSSSQNTVSIGPMTGASDITSDKKMIESISNSIAATEKKTALAESEDYVMKYLDVKIIDLSNEPI